MNKSVALSIFATILTAAYTCFAAVQPENGLLFYCGFENGVRAETAAGNPVPVVEGRLEVVDGHTGKGLLTGDGFITKLSYENKGNFEVKQGTVSLWIKPQDWLGAEGTAKLFHLFRQGDSLRGYYGLELQRFSTKNPVLLFYSLKFPKQDRVAIADKKSSAWSNGVWRHVAFTWDDQEVKLYTDGALAGSGQLTAPYAESDIAARSFSFGTKGEEHTVIDNVGIWNRPLSAAEITGLYQGE
jgi:hypothetical protein